MSKKETLEKFFKFMEKWRYEDFNAFENHFNKLMSMKSKEQLTNENEALKDSIAVILAQKKNVHKHCDEKDQQIDQLKQQLDEKDEQINNLEQMCQICNKDQENEKLKQELAEKDKEIESLKQQLEETNAGYDFTYEQSSEAVKELKQNQTQLAIQELEKVNTILYESHYKQIGNKYYATLEDIENVISEQIELLKGEKNNG